MAQRRQFEQTTSLKERLAAFAEEARKKDQVMNVGADREELLRKARRAETAAHIDDWVNSPGFQPPK